MQSTIWDKLQHELQRKDSRWRVLSAALHNRLMRVHPETGGHMGLVHNWGNAAAREAVARFWQSWRAYADSADRRINALMREFAKGN